MYSDAFFYPHGHEKLDLKSVYGGDEKFVEGNKICPKKVHTSEVENARKMIEPRVLEKIVRLVTNRLAQVNNCYRK